MTFGGAYAVLSYIADAAVNVYGWLEPGEMANGLALAESTPGPLIMVTQYVGFMAGWRFAGEMAPFWSGTLAAAVTTYVTFLPCFFFIFAGAPYIEALAGNRRLQGALVGVTAAVVGVILNLAVQGALVGVTAAVVGVILNLAVFFTSHVLFTENGRPDGFAVVLAVLAFLALRRLHWQLHTVVVLGAVTGLGWVLTRSAVGL